MNLPQDDLLHYVLRLADTPLILAQRLGAWCGHAPELEIDLALANIALDLLGQARNFYQYAAGLAGPGWDEDRFAFQRDESAFSNLLLAEQPNGGFNDTLVRQFLLDAWHHCLYRQLSLSRDASLAAIAAKALKEVTYHLRFSSGWMIRLGDGTLQSHDRMQQALNGLWRFTAEPFLSDATEQRLLQQGIAPDAAALQAAWHTLTAPVLQAATLPPPTEAAWRHGGKQGQHSEHFGYLLAEMQFLPRSQPGCRW